MAWWITVYCTRSVARISPVAIHAGLRDRDPEAPAGVDYHLLAENLDLDESVVDDALEHLVVGQAPGRPSDVELRYRADPDSRPVVVHRWADSDRVSEEVEECKDVRSPPADVVSMLPDVCEVVGIELGGSQLGDMGVVFAFELARFFAQRGDGAVVDDEGQWLGVHDGAWVDL